MAGRQGGGRRWRSRGGGGASAGGLLGHVAARLMLLDGRRRALAAFGAGLLGVLSLPPFDVFGVMFVAFPLLVWILDGASGDADAGFLGRLRPAFFAGWWFGFGYFVGGLWWLGNALLVDAEGFAWALPIAIFGLPALLAIFYGLAAALARAFWSDGAGRIFALAGAFGLAEWTRALAFTGFPWNAVGYAAMPFPLLMQSDGIVGLFTMSAAAVFVFSAPALLATRTGMRAGLAFAALLAVAHVGYGAYRLHVAGPQAAAVADATAPVFRLVQPQVDQSTDWSEEDRRRIFEEYLKLSALPPAEGGRVPKFIVWPETAIPYILTESPAALARIAEVLQPGQVLVAGVVRVEAATANEQLRYYNSIDVIDDTGQIVAAADKVHLVPFGEYLPFEDWLDRAGFSAVAAMPDGGFSAAATRAMLRLPDGPAAWPLICYEAIFPDSLDFRQSRPDFLLNLTNDAWFGHTPGPYQHLLQARLRAVETGLPLIRASNNGISVVVDGYGRVTAGIGLGSAGAVDATLTGKNAAVTAPERKNLIFWLTISLSFILAGIARMSLAKPIN